MRFVKIAIILAFNIVLGTLADGQESNKNRPSSQLRRFAKDVIYVVDAGDRERTSKRLPGEIFLDFHGQENEKGLVLRHLREFCDLTDVKLVADLQGSPAAAKISVYFGSLGDLEKIAKTLERKILIQNGYAYWVWWDQSKVINRACVFIAADKLSGNALEDALIKGVFGVFGLPSRSGEVEESCLSSKNSRFQSLQPIDKVLLEFYYQSVPAGTNSSDFDKIFREKWGAKNRSE